MSNRYTVNILVSKSLKKMGDALPGFLAKYMLGHLRTRVEQWRSYLGIASLRIMRTKNKPT